MYRIISCEELIEFLNDLKKDIVECFIFFYNVRKVSIFIVNEDGLLKREFVVKVEIFNKLDEGNLYIIICNVWENMKKDGLFLCIVVRREIKYILNLNINDEYV